MDIMENIWFCHTPIDGKPCGLCNPCKTKMESNMEFLLPKKSQKRYRHMSMIEKIFGKYGVKVYKRIAGKN